MMPFRFWLRRVGAALDVARLVVLFNLLGVAKRVVPLRSLARWAWSPRVDRDPASLPTIVGRVLRAGRYAGVPDRDCLQRSLLLYRELSRAGASPRLVVGFRRSAAVEGHAWVTVDGRLLADAAEALETFTPVMRFHDRGLAERLDRASLRS
jgi:hypothetical protein